MLSLLLNFIGFRGGHGRDVPLPWRIHCGCPYVPGPGLEVTELFVSKVCFSRQVPTPAGPLRPPGRAALHLQMVSSLFRGPVHFPGMEKPRGKGGREGSGRRKAFQAKRKFWKLAAGVGDGGRDPVPPSACSAGAGRPARRPLGWGNRRTVPAPLAAAAPPRAAQGPLTPSPGDPTSLYLHLLRAASLGRRGCAPHFTDTGPEWVGAGVQASSPQKRFSHPGSGIL